MKKILGAAAILVVATVPAIAGMRYDRNLEKAAMAIVASKIGDIRGGFSYKEKVQLVVRQDEAPHAVAETRRQNAANTADRAPSPNAPSPSITRF